jgi:hypothetical protein
MNASELRFRRLLKPVMEEQWMMTWHEDRGISPGVPDLHYVVFGDNPNGYRVGWLELKSIDREIGKASRIKVEPSQHQYIRRYLPYMPIHFLVRANKVVYLIDGKYAAALPLLDSPNSICAISLAHFDQDHIAVDLPPLLRNITRI